VALKSYKTSLIELPTLSQNLQKSNLATATTTANMKLNQAASAGGLLLILASSSEAFVPRSLGSTNNHHGLLVPYQGGTLDATSEMTTSTMLSMSSRGYGGRSGSSGDWNAGKSFLYAGQVVNQRPSSPTSLCLSWYLLR